MGAQSQNPSFEGKKVTSKRMNSYNVEGMLVNEEVQAEEKAVTDVHQDASSHSEGHVSDVSSIEDGSHSASDLDDDYTEALKSLSLKAASFTGTPSKKTISTSIPTTTTSTGKSSISNADNPKKESEITIMKVEHSSENSSVKVEEAAKSSSESESSLTESIGSNISDSTEKIQSPIPIEKNAAEPLKKECCKKDKLCSTGSCCEKPKPLKPPCCQGGSCSKKPNVLPPPQTNAEEKRSCTIM